jgi:hypothetical protein
METFDLGRLTDFDFEAVCKDLLEEELGLRLEIFASGADGGVDLRHLRPANDSLIVQCKHWHRSGRAKLIDYIQSVEAKKVAKLKPRRYILATSVSITKDAKDKLFDALKPYVKTPSDIYGKEEIDALLRKRSDCPQTPTSLAYERIRPQCPIGEECRHPFPRVGARIREHASDLRHESQPR